MFTIYSSIEKHSNKLNENSPLQTKSTSLTFKITVRLMYSAKQIAIEFIVIKGEQRYAKIEREECYVKIM